MTAAQAETLANVVKRVLMDDSEESGDFHGLEIRPVDDGFSAVPDWAVYVGVIYEGEEHTFRTVVDLNGDESTEETN